MHVDEWLDTVVVHMTEGEAYARFFLDCFRWPETKKIHYAPFLPTKPVYCLYEGQKWRCTGASRRGDVWLASNLNRKMGYDLRVDVEDCTGWEIGSDEGGEERVISPPGAAIKTTVREVPEHIRKAIAENLGKGVG